MRVAIDHSWQRYGSTVIAGSPLRVYRLTPAGERVARIVEETGDPPPSTLVERWLDGGAVHPLVAGRPGGFTMDDVTVVTPQLGGRPWQDGRITVDDGSSPPIEGATIRLDRNVGPAAARNAGRSLVSTPLVAFVDADVDTLDELGGGCWMTALLAHFEDPRVAVVAPRVCGEDGSPLDLGPHPGRVRAGTRISYVPGAALLVRLEAFDAVGGFDESLRLGEDVDLVWRLDEAGWRCRYDPGVMVWHEPRPTERARLRQHASYGSSAAALAVRHPGALAPLRSNGWTAATWFLAAIGRPASAALLAVGSAAALPRKLPDVPPAVAFWVALTGHGRATQQLASAVRREWWPIVAAAALVSRRARWLALVAVLADPAATPTDLAYGWGVWRGMVRTRSIAPVVPRLSPWPARRGSVRPSASTPSAPNGDAR